METALDYINEYINKLDEAYKINKIEFNQAEIIKELKKILYYKQKHIFYF